MRKLTTKLLFAIISAAFALVALGTTTFAWFTLTETATVSQFDAQLTAGEGIEISVDNGTNFYTTVPTSVIQNIAALENIRLKDLTSTDGVELKSLTGVKATLIEQTSTGTGEDKVYNSAPNPYIEFDVIVRSPKTGTKVYVSKVLLSSEAIAWTPDVAFNLADGTPVTSATEDLSFYASNALRVSFAEKSAEFAALVYEQEAGTDDNVRLDQSIKDNGMVSYYKEKNGVDLNATPAPTGIIREVPVATDGELYTTDESGSMIAGTEITTLIGETYTGFYDGTITVRVWVEGWDPDTYNAILNGKIKVTIVFIGV